MARPRRQAGEKTAYERIEHAFWELLSQMPYAKITISGICKKAEVNHNLIYYYFENIDDMATRLFYANMEKGNSQKFIRELMNGRLEGNKILEDPVQLAYIQRLRLFMRDDSAFLNRLVKDKLIQEWLAAAGKDYECLTPEQKVDLNFIFSGVVSALGSELFETDPGAIAGLPGRHLGMGIIQTLQSLSTE